MKRNRLLLKLRSDLNSLHLTDKCLLIFMVILMSQSVHNLFFRELAMRDTHMLDVVVRTTAAAIFGYFISANFQNGNQNMPQSDSVTPTSSSPPQPCNRIQIIVVATIGIASLLLLLMARNFISMNSNAIPTLSQLRDFVSGSVGFLIGHSTQRSKP